MAKTNATFKFGKMNKIKLGNIIDPVARSIFKKCMIDAQSAYMSGKNRKFSDPAVTQKPNRGSPSENKNG
jgi:hypothetical protein